MTEPKYVTAEVAARRLGVTMKTMYDYLALQRGDWHLVNDRWRINLESLLQRRAEDEKWRAIYRETHIAVPAEPRVPVDTRPEPNWDAMPEWLELRAVAEILGLLKPSVCALGLKGVLHRKEQPGRVPTGITQGGGPRNARRRWLYLRDSVRRFWHRQEGRAHRRALRGECFRDWGPRDAKDIPTFWQDTVDTRTAAEMLCVSRQYIANLCRTGKLPAYQNRPGRGGSRLRIPRAAVMRYAMHVDRAYWREMHSVETAEPEPGEERLREPERFDRDAERRNVAHRKRLEIGEFYSRASAEADRIREGHEDMEEGTIVQLGFGYTEWTPVDNDFVPIECWPLRREFGERERDHRDFYSTSQVARILGVCKGSVRSLRRTGRLQGYQRKKHRNENGSGNWWWFYRKEDVEVLQSELQRRHRARRRDDD